MKIEVLYFSGCPNHAPAVERVREALRDEGLRAEIVETEVADPETAQRMKFLGSPSIRVNGLDIEPEARSRTAFGIMCRTYADGCCQNGLPSPELIRAALREARAVLAESRRPESTRPEPRQSGLRRSFLFGGSLMAAVAASLCCILPILAAVSGAGAIAAGAVFDRWRPYLLGLTGLLLAGGFLLAWRDGRKACAADSLCATQPMRRWNLIALGLLATGVAALAAFPYYSGAVARLVVREPGPPPAIASAGLSTVAFQVPDMDCPACAVALSAAFRKLPGVAEAKLDVDSRKAVVTYDPNAQNIATLKKVIIDAGFHIAAEPRAL
jgi:copper chaperone CopZ